MPTDTRRQPDGLDLTALRARLAGQQGPRYWRSLEELAETPEFLAYLDREFPEQASEWTDRPSRRTFLKLMGASLALAGVERLHDVGAGREDRALRADARAARAGQAALLRHGGAAGRLCHRGARREPHGAADDGRGERRHPDSLGAIDPWTQATVLDALRPRPLAGRQPPAARSAPGTTSCSRPTGAIDAAAGQEGGGAADPDRDGHLAHPGAAAPRPARRLPRGEVAPVRARRQATTTRAGARLAFGEDVAVRYHLDKADVILALDADFLATGPGRLCYARDFAARREPQAGQDEPALRRRAGADDHRHDGRPPPGDPVAPDRRPRAGDRRRSWASKVAPAGRAALAERSGAGSTRWRATSRSAQGDEPGRGGRDAAALVHALAHALNEALGNVGKTVEYLDPVEAEPVDQVESLRTLVGDMEAGRVELLLILGGNPVYNAPADVDFAKALEKVAPQRPPEPVRRRDLGGVPLATARGARAGGVERRAGVRRHGDDPAALDRAALRRQVGARAARAAAQAGRARTGYDLVRETWKAAPHEGDFEAFWRTSVHDGVVAGTASKVEDGHGQASRTWFPPAAAGQSRGSGADFRPDPTIHDGRFANNGWLQELPKPLTKLTWDNAAQLSLGDGRAARADDRPTWSSSSYQERTVQAPVWIDPGQADDTVTVHLGYGRTRAGRVGTGAGFNAYALRTSDAPWSGPGVAVRATGQTYALASTQLHRTVNWIKDETAAAAERELVREATLADFLKDPRLRHRRARARSEHEPALERLALRQLQVRRLCLGDGDQPECLHRLQRAA